MAHNEAAIIRFCGREFDRLFQQMSEIVKGERSGEPAA